MLLEHFVLFSFQTNLTFSTAIPRPMAHQDAILFLKQAMAQELPSEADLQGLQELIHAGRKARIDSELSAYQAQAEAVAAIMAESATKPELMAELSQPPTAEAEQVTEPADSPVKKKVTTTMTGSSVNARFAGLTVGLNDRVAFVKQLFGGESDDFERVVAALATMESQAECERFLEDAVYPDHDWTGLEEFSDRFHAMVFARFE